MTFFTVIKGTGLEPQKPKGKVLPPQTDEQAAKQRAQMIASGQIVESEYVYPEGQRPAMSKAMINRLQEKLYKLGIITPKPRH